MSKSNWWNDFEAVNPLEAALQAEGITGKLAELARSIYAQESSSGKHAGTSNAGAVGGMQVLPGTFESVADEGWDIRNPVDNARAGVRYLGEMLDRAKGDVYLAAVGYYGGPKAQDKAQRGDAVTDPRNPKAPNTLQYAEKVVGRMGNDKQDKAPQAGRGDWWSDMPLADVGGTTNGKGDTTTSKEAKPEPKSFAGEALRQIGLTGRAAVNGVAALPAMLSDALTGPINAGLDAVRGPGNGFRFQRAGAAVNDLMTAAGVPEPEGSTERVVQDVAAALAGTGSTVGAGKLLEKGSSALAKRVGQILAEGSGLQTVSAATGAGASALTRENGGGEAAQVAAGLLGGVAPSVAQVGAGAAVRGALRGGEAGQKAVADRVAAFRAAGVEPTVGQATEGRIARATESLLSKAPGGAGVMARFAEKQSDDLAGSIRQLSDDLAPGASAVNAGEAIVRGVNTFRDGVKSLQRKLYETLDQHIPAGTPISVTKTRQALAELNAGIPGAQQTSGLFSNTRIAGIEEALLSDLDGDGRLPYEAIKSLRSLVGRELTDNVLTSDVPRSMWSRLYGALSDDLGSAAKAAGPDAAEAWQWANTFTKQQMKRLDDLQGIVNKDTAEKVFAAAISGTAEGDTLARRVIGALPAKERREVAAAVLQRLGRASPGQQNAVGDAFSSEAFLSNLAKLSPDARATLLGRTDLPGVLEKLDNFAAVAGSRRDGSHIFGNPSGTAPAAAQMGVAGAVGAGAVSSVATGNPAPLAGALAVPAAANLGAKAMTSKRLVDMAATSTPLPAGAEAALMRSAGGMNTAAEEMPPPQDIGNWWESLPQVDPMSGTYERLPNLLQQEGIQPSDKRSMLERIGDAQSVSEAIRAVQEPDQLQDAQIQVADKRAAVAREIAQIQAMRLEAQRIRDAERMASINHERDVLGLRLISPAASME